MSHLQASEGGSGVGLQEVAPNFSSPLIPRLPIPFFFDRFLADRYLVPNMPMEVTRLDATDAF